MREIEFNGRARVANPSALGVFVRAAMPCRITNMSNLPYSFRLLAAVTVVTLLPHVVPAQNAFSPGGVEYPITGALPGDQSMPAASVGTNGGYLVWEGNAIDGAGLGIQMERLDGNFNKLSNPFRVNAQAVGDQEQPDVAKLSNGGAVVVWQGGQYGFQKIYARILPAAGTNFSTGDILVNSYTNSFQIDPSVTVLTNGDIVVVWSSFGQDGSLQGIYGQRFNPSGAKLGGEFQINQFGLNNQRTPAVAALADGRFVVAWVSELQRALNSVDIYARVFDASGLPVGNEFPVNTTLAYICANPQVVGSPGGGFAVAWSQREGATGNSFSSQFTVAGANIASDNSWDVYVRTYNSTSAALSGAVRMNTYSYGDQFAPQLGFFGKDYLAVWTSLGQDGSMEGIYGQFMSQSGQLAGVEFRVNTDYGSRQVNPTVASDGVSRFLVVWSSYATSGNFDLFAREYDLIRVSISPTGQGVKVSWNTRPGSTYQVQSSSDYSSWSAYGAARYATGFSDSIDINSATSASAYRVIRIQ